MHENISNVPFGEFRECIHLYNSNQQYTGHFHHPRKSTTLLITENSSSTRSHVVHKLTLYFW